MVHDHNRKAQHRFALIDVKSVSRSIHRREGTMRRNVMTMLIAGGLFLTAPLLAQDPPRQPMMQLGAVKQ
jgi:hypothetical protein